MAAAAQTGIAVDSKMVPVLPETHAICTALGLDPLRLIASGALLIAVAPADVARVAQVLQSRGTPVSEIGAFTPADEGLRLDGAPFTFPERDEIARAFE